MADIVVLEATAFSVRVQVSPRPPLRHIQQLNWDSLLNYKTNCVLFLCGCGVMANTSAFQADDTGSIPVTRSNGLDAYSNLNHQNCPKVKTPPSKVAMRVRIPFPVLFLWRLEFLEK